MISLRFQHADPAVVQRVLDHLIKARFEQLRKMQQEEMERPDDADRKKNENEPALVKLALIQAPSEPRLIESDRFARSLPKLGKQKAEPDGADQPATDPESKPEGHDKPKAK